MESLQAELHFIRRTLFPEWDRECEWRVREGRGPGYLGQGGWCCPGTKTIYVEFPAEMWSVCRDQSPLLHELRGFCKPGMDHRQVLEETVYLTGALLGHIEDGLLRHTLASLTA